MHGALAMLGRAGVRGLYFHWMAKLVHEPFVGQWHNRRIEPWLAAAGFRVIEHADDIPTRFVIAVRE